MITSGWTTKYILLVVFTCILLAGNVFFVPQTNAQTDSSTSSPKDAATNTPFRERIQDVREDAAERRDQVREHVASRTDAVREKVQDRRVEIRDQMRDRVKNLVGNIKRRMNAAIERMGNIAGRLVTRIEKLEERGVDGTEALRLVGEAKSELSAASSIITGTDDAEVDTVIDSDIPKDAFASIKTKLREAAEHIRNAHQLLRDAIVALKEAILEAQSTENTDEAENDDVGDETLNQE